MERLPAQTQDLYSELFDRLLAEAGRRDPSRAPGTFTLKKVKGETYVYFQYSEPGGKCRQLYVGKKSPETDRLEKRFSAGRKDAAAERRDLERLCAQVLAGGAWAMGSRAGRVLESFAAAGVFETGTVLVGTHAFGVLGNVLGARWVGRNLRTQDLDLAAISLVAARADARADAPGVLERLRMGFLPVPALDARKPSTSFKVRGDALRVDFLTPGSGGRPVPLPRLKTSAHPLPYLDFLLENPQRAAVPERGGFLVLVPDPARFALHKILVSQEREAAFQTKAGKDLAQGGELIQFLHAERPRDLKSARDGLRRRGWDGKLRKGWKRLVAVAGREGLPGLSTF